MKKLKLALAAAIAAAATLATTMAYATQPTHPPGHAYGHHKAHSASHSTSSATATANPVANASGGAGGAGGAGGQGGAGGHATSSASGGGGGKAASSNTLSQSYEAQARNPVSTAVGPVIPPTAVCMGSTSGGAQGVAVGVSFGTSWTDANCMLLEQVRTTSQVLGDQKTAAEMMCGIAAYREARERTGHPCKVPSEKRAEQAQPVYTDPIIRHRLGLPPMEGSQ